MQQIVDLLGAAMLRAIVSYAEHYIRKLRMVR